MTAGTALARAGASALATLTLLLLLGSGGVAFAAAPSISIEAPLTGSSTSNQRPLFSGVSSDNEDLVTVELYAGSSAGGTAVQTLALLVPTALGAWSGEPESPLAQGTYTAVAEQSDESEPGVSAPVTFTVDTTPPTVTIDALPSPTNNPTPTLEGDAPVEPGSEEAVTVTIYKGDTTGGSIVGGPHTLASSGGVWQYSSPHLPDGTYTAQVARRDEAGNVGTSAPVTFILDTTPPAVSITSPADISTAHVSRPTFSGLAGHATGDEPSITLKIYEGSQASGSPVQTVEHIVPGGGAWTTGTTGPALPNGTYTAVAEQLDEAGNLGSAATTFKVETDSPVLTLHTLGLVQRGGEAVSGPMPSFSGTAGGEPEDGASVTVQIYRGAAASGIPVESVSAPVIGSGWTSQAAAALPDGTYTAQAEQADSDPFAQSGVSEASTFSVDADPPLVTLRTPTDGGSVSGSTQPLSGSAGVAEGDLPTITVALFSGATVSAPTPLETVAVQASHGTWTAAFGGLAPGTYTAQAEQRDDVGNVGYSTPVTFTVLASAQSTPPATQESASLSPSPSPFPPAASFTWFPTAPHTGEAVSLVSTSTDSQSPLTAFAWDLTGDGAFGAGGPSVSTSFASPGAHVVQLRVTNTAGLSSVVAETIDVSSPTASLMQPFPVVRMAGSQFGFGVKVRLLTVQAPTGAKVTVSCHGPGCPAGSVHVVATSKASTSPTALVTITFARFERTLRAGASLAVGISEPGVIGKYTRFVIRRGKLPLRTDTCLSPTSSQPIACPAT